MSNAITLQCASCGKQYALTPDYQSQYAGQSAPCECGASMTVPTLATSRPAARGEIIAGWRDGGYVVAEKGTKLPRLCIKCGAPVKDQMIPIVLEWVPGKVMAQGIFGFIGNAIAEAGGESIIVRHGRCPIHRTWWTRRRLRMSFIIAAVASFVLLIISASGFESLIMISGCMAALLVCLIGAVITSIPPLRIVAFQKKRAWIAGFGKAYVAALPALTEAVEVDSALAAESLEELTDRSA